MKRFVAAAAVLSLAALSPALAQEGKSLASTMDVYVFPTKGQAASEQSQDEATCYSWAVDNTGTDPFALSKQAQEQQAQADAAKAQVDAAGQGAGAKGAVGGAAAGALIGGIANDDPGKGAAYGAAAGMIAGRRRSKRAKADANQQIEQGSQKAQASTAEDLENFKKAFSVCLEAKDYMVKF